jgi:hypothetical protein
LYKKPILHGFSMASLEVIVNDGLMALKEESLHNMAPNITSASCNEYG